MAVATRIARQHGEPSLPATSFFMVRQGL